MTRLFNRPFASSSLLRVCGFILAFATLNLSLLTNAHAVPSFARQTGQDCAACHVGAFGPQLTPYGMRFKMEGYTDSNGKSWNLPLSGMVSANWTHTSKDQKPAPDNFKSNDNAVLQEVSLFLAGKLADNVGAFVQGTYSGIDHFSSLDQADIRLAHSFDLGGKDVILGLSLNNNPTLTDPFNTMGAWRFPYTSAEIAPSPANTTMLDDMLGQQVIGLNAYTLWDKSWYAEVGGYRALPRSALGSLNDLQDPADDVGRINGIAPYWRLGYLNSTSKQAYSFGLFGMRADLKPDRSSGGPYDQYRDIGVDASYQYLGNRKNIYSLNGSYTHETRAMDFSGSGDGHLNRLDLNASYFYDQTYGLSVGLFDTRGNNNAALWGTGNGKPDSSGYMLQADWTPFGKESSWLAPWANLRLGLQYTGYSKFDGSTQNARDNNTTSLFLWTAF